MLSILQIVVQHTGAATEPAQVVEVKDAIPGEELAYVDR